MRYTRDASRRSRITSLCHIAAFRLHEWLAPKMRLSLTVRPEYHRGFLQTTRKLSARLSDALSMRAERDLILGFSSYTFLGRNFLLHWNLTARAQDECNSHFRNWKLSCVKLARDRPPIFQLEICLYKYVKYTFRYVYTFCHVFPYD